MDTIRPPKSVEVMGHPKEAVMRILYQATDAMEEARYGDALKMVEDIKLIILAELLNEVKGDGRGNEDTGVYRKRVAERMRLAIAEDRIPDTDRAPTEGGEIDYWNGRKKDESIIY